MSTLSASIPYDQFVLEKKLSVPNVGFEPEMAINKQLFQFQHDITVWALRKGRAALFEDCGLGKTPQQLEWAKHISEREKAPVLIVAPLAVSQQTQMEGVKFDVPVNICSDQSDVIQGVNITNYERLHKFVGHEFSGVVLDESSILKNMAGATRNQIIDMFRSVPYKLACTATPSPNDYMELGNHAEFLGVMTYAEMLSMFFINDSGKTGQWRLKKHAKEIEFWKWLCSWAVMLSKPSDLGYTQDGFDLPPLEYIEHKLKSTTIKSGHLLPIEAATMFERMEVRRETVRVRCERAAELINQTKDQWVVWCGLNAESQLLTELIDDAWEVTGTQDYSTRETRMLGFTTGAVKRLVTKPSIAGFGMNWQNCHKMAFVGLSDSWEQLYQATRRLWRFGQKFPVEAHIIIEAREGAVLQNITRKDAQAQRMIRNIVACTKEITKKEVRECEEEEKYPAQMEMCLPSWMKKS